MMEMKKRYLLLLSVGSGLIFTLGWPEKGFPVLLFLSFVPLLYIEEYCFNRPALRGKWRVFHYTYPAFLIWNLLTTWWIWNSTSFGAIMAIGCNAAFMALVFQLYHYSKKLLKHKVHAYFALISYWISFEFLHSDWDLSWTWLNLGNSFGGHTEWVQWYEFTGVFGGSLWILLLNILLYEWGKAVFSGRSAKKLMGSVLLLLLVPLAYSFIRYFTYEERGNPVSTVVVQQNTDPYHEQYEIAPEIITHRILQLARKELDTHVSFVVCPESALQEYLWEDQKERSVSVDSLYQTLIQYPKLHWVVGVSTRKQYFNENEVSPTARKSEKSPYWYDVFNSSMFLEAGYAPQYYHKSKLVPGVEMMPFPAVLKPLEKFAINLGGMTGSLGKDPIRKVFHSHQGAPDVGACVCYESIYGEFVAEFVRNGAGLLFVITNDGWWGDTPGYRQHFLFSKLRAIENRRDIARSANTGISAFINQKGDVSQATPYWTPAVIKQTLYANDTLTLYSRFGDYIGRFMLMAAALLFLISLMMRYRKNKKN